MKNPVYTRTSTVYTSIVLVRVGGIADLCVRGCEERQECERVEHQQVRGRRERSE